MPGDDNTQQNGQGGAANPQAGTGSDPQGGTQKPQDGADPNSKTVPYDALHAERERRKEAEAEAQKLRDAEKARQDDELKKRGEHEKLLAQRDEELKTTQQQLAERDQKLEAFKTSAQKRVDESLSKITDEGQKEFIKGVLQKYDVSEWESVLPNLIKSVNPTQANVNGSAQNTGNSTQGGQGNELQELQKQLEEAKKSRNAGAVLSLEMKIEKLKGAKS